MSLEFLKRTDAAAERKARSIHAALTRLARSRRFVQIDFDGDARTHQSLILRVAPEAGCLLIDELFPSDDGSQGRPGQACTISTRELGVEVSFHTQVIERVSASSGHAYKLVLPEVIERRERRDAFRIAVAHLPGSEATLVLPEGVAEQPHVRNLSATGIALGFDGDVTVCFERGRRIAECHFRLAPEVELECGIEVRNARLLREPVRHTVVGARFLDLARDDRRAIERLLMNRERDLRKRGVNV